MDNNTLAMELLKELKLSSRRWFIAFLVALALWFVTIGLFIWYVSLPVEEVTIENEDGAASYIGDNNSIVGGLQNGRKGYSEEAEIPQEEEVSGQYRSSD